MRKHRITRRSVQKSRPEIENFPNWKWASLGARRIYVFLLLEIIFVFSWGVTANYSSHSNVYWRDYFGGIARATTYWVRHFGKLKAIETFAPTLYHCFAPVLTFIHGVALVWGWVVGPILSIFPEFQGSDVVRFCYSSQGFKALQFLGWSAIFVMLYVISNAMTMTWSSYLPPTDVYLGVCCMFSAIFAANQIGDDVWMMSMRCFVAVPVWFAYYWYHLRVRVYSSIFEPLTVFAALLIMIFGEICKEQDLQNIYENLYAAHHRELLLIGDGDEDPEHMPSQVKYQFSVSGDIAYTLNTVIESLNTITSHLEGSMATEILPVPIYASKVALDKNKPDGYSWNKSAAHIYEARILCLSMIMSSISFLQEDLQRSINVFQEETFEFSKLCVRIFSLVEACRGHGMALFVDDHAMDYFVTAAKGFIEILIYLLLHENIQNANISGSSDLINAICWVRCSIVDGAWTILVSATQNFDAIAASKRESGANKNSSSSLRLASQLAKRFMHTRIGASEYVDKASNVVTTHYSFPIPGKVVASVGPQDKWRLLMADHSPSWLIVDLHTSPRDMQENQRLIFSLKNLVIPFEVCNGTEQLRSWAKKHSVVVVTESGLHVKQMLILFDLVRVTGGSLIVISEGKTPSHFRDLYDIEVAYCMGTSVSSVFRAVQIVYEKHTARVLTEEKLCSV